MHAWTGVCLAIVLCYGQSVVSGQDREIRMGFITPRTGVLGYDVTAAAATMAVNSCKDDGYLQNATIKFIWHNGACDGKAALGVTVKLKYESDVDGYIGLPCSVASINAGKIIANWDVPHFSYSSTDPTLADKVMYNTLVRLISPFNKFGDALQLYFEMNNWKRAVLVMFTAKDRDQSCDYARKAFEAVFKKGNVSVADQITTEAEEESEDTMDQWLDNIRMRSRIVIICAEQPMVRQFMMVAHSKGMTNGDYVYIYPTLLPPGNLKTLWATGDRDDDVAKLAFRPLMMMALGSISSSVADEFRDRLPYEMLKPPWNYTGMKRGSIFSLYVRDAVYMYCLAVDQCLKLTGDPRKGTLIFNLAKNITFNGVSGRVELDDNGDRIGDYSIWYMNWFDNSNQGYELYATIRLTDPDNPIEFESNGGERYWGPAYEYKTPLDAPKCGFYGELCPPDNSDRDTIIIAVCLVAVFIIGIATAVVVMIRRKRFEDELERMLWRVRYEELDFIKSKVKGSARTMASQSTMTSASAVSANPGIGLHLEVAHFKGQMVVVKRLVKTGIMLTRHDHLELKQMRELNHENVNGFVGLCVDPPNVCIITMFCSRGSLQDILENDNIKLDIMFKISLVSDLIHGLEYVHRYSFPVRLAMRKSKFLSTWSGLEHLHRSLARAHGRLKSTNCVVDGRWVLKITDFGLNNIREDPEDDSDKYRALFWTSPELLREPDKNGTQKGDVYSFSIIVQEILYRGPPYEAAGDLNMVPKDLIGRIRNGETPPFRPVLPHDEKIDTRIIELMRSCWEEDVNQRPDMVAVKQRFSEINKGKRFNIMDNMLRMMEKYANNLEEIVDSRTRQLTEEKKKTDMLLYRMLPASIAESLKAGKTIVPEMYHGASIYFSDIVSFTTLSSESSPLEVVDFLNDLWTLFDSIIDKHEVYKVETIGDAYMVCSGLPKLNEDHALEIANMALEILSSVLTFKIRHRPDKQLKVRIGIHSGPVVAGIVGQSMPRYCLFGDTVNTSSRMESTGEALKIHISASTHSFLSMCLKYKYIMSKRGEIDVKGKGRLTTYWLEGREGFGAPLPSNAT